MVTNRTARAVPECCRMLTRNIALGNKVACSHPVNSAKQACSLHAKNAMFSKLHESYIHTGIPWLLRTDLDIAAERHRSVPLTHANMYLPQGTQ